MSVRLVVESSDQRIRNEKSFPLSLSFELLKEKLESVFGCSSRSMNVEHYDERDRLLQLLAAGNQQYDQMTLLQLGMQNYHVLRIGCGEQSAALTEASNVPKYEMPSDDYVQRTDTFYRWKQSNIPKKETSTMPNEHGFCDSLSIGMRCIVTSGENHRIGTIRWLGTLDGQLGQFVGVELDFAVGSHDGTFNGKRYFTAPANSAIFTRPQSVQVHPTDADDMLMEEL